MTINEDDGKRIQSTSPVVGSASTQITTFNDYVFYEKETIKSEEGRIDTDKDGTRRVAGAGRGQGRQHRRAAAAEADRRQPGHEDRDAGGPVGAARRLRVAALRDDAVRRTARRAAGRAARQLPRAQSRRPVLPQCAQRLAAGCCAPCCLCA